MRIAVIGGGGSRTPLLYHGLLERLGDLPETHLVLHDTSAEWLGRVARVLRGIDQERGSGVPTTSTTDLDAALDGADFVLTAIRAGGFEARRRDEAIAQSHGVVGQETVGPGGFGLALRNVPALLQVAERIRRCCPDAWVINLTNPAGLVTEALWPHLGDRVVGVCDSPVALMRRVAGALDLPFDALHFEYGGLNHLGWLTAVWHDGRDMLPDLLAGDRIEEVEEVRLVGVDRVRALRAIPNEYLYFYERSDDARANVSGNGSRGAFLADRRRALATAVDDAATPAQALDAYRAALKQRQDTYLTAESGMSRAPTVDVFAEAGGYHEMALSVVEAVACDAPAVAVVNTRNRGALPFLPGDTVVEVPALIRAAGVFPLACHVPASQRGLIERVKAFETTTLDAIRSRSRDVAVRGLASHPLVPSRQAADAIVADHARQMPSVSALLERS